MSWRLILFRYNHAGAAELWTVDPTNGAVQQVQTHDVAHEAALSPVGETVAYIRVSGGEPGSGATITSELWLMDRDGANPRPLYAPERGVLSHPVWQPDGQALYFQESAMGSGSMLRRIPLTGGEPSTILTDCLDFALSPDGEQLVSVTQGGQLLLSNQDGKDVREIAPQPAALADYGWFTFSPDGQRLAFCGSKSSWDSWNLYVVDLADLQVRRLTNLSAFQPFTSSSGQVNGLAWTFEGTHLVYSVDGHPKQVGIWTISSDGEDRRRLWVWEEGEWAAVQGPWFEEK